MTTERKLVTIRKVIEIREIKGADNIELAIVDAWKCIVKKGDFKVGDIGVYFEIDSYLPLGDKRYEFLEKSSRKKIKAELQGIKRYDGYRLKGMKLRGELSQGLLMPVGLFPELDDCKIGDDVAEKLNVVKYEQPLPAQLAGKAKGNFPSFIPRTDEERIQNLPDYLGKYKKMEFEITEKVDGTSMTVYFRDGDIGVCSRNLDLTEAEDNSLWKAARESGVLGYLQHKKYNYAIQGELIGEGIQKNKLKLKGHHFYIFNVFLIEDGRYASPEERKLIFKDMESFGSTAKHVPILDYLRLEDFNSVDEILYYAASNKSMVNKEEDREGVVFKQRDEYNGELVSFKAINNDYIT